MRRSKRFKKNRQLHDLSLTPLIDVALTLLVIFMVAAPMIQQHGISINLPKGSQELDHKQPQELVVHIDKDKRLYVNSTEVSLNTLAKQLTHAIGDTHDRMVLVKADERVEYGTVIEVMDTVKPVQGVQYVALATEKRT